MLSQEAMQRNTHTETEKEFLKCFDDQDNKKDHPNSWCNSITNDLYKKALDVLGL